MRYAVVAGRQRHIFGWRRDLPDHRDRVASMSLTAAAPPASADLRPRCPPVRDQGGIGSCVANATLEAMGFLYTRIGLVDPQLSRLFTYWHTRAYEGTPPGEDAGCQIRCAMKVLRALGSCLEEVWPYVDDGKRFAVEPSAAARDEALRHQVLLYYRCPSLSTVKASIAQGFPVVFGFAVPETIYAAEVERTGDVPFPTPALGFVGGHAVLAVGYDDATQKIRFQNSWGSAWGDAGFGTLPYRYFSEGLADDFWSLRAEEM
jgi:C1A family cysteine protease